MEETIFTIRPSMRPIGVFYAACLVVLAFFVFLAIKFHSIFFIFPGLLFLFAPAAMQIRRRFTIYTLTNENIKIRTGIIGKTQTMIPLAKVQNVSFSYSIIQRMLGIGDILLESAAEKGAVPFLDIDKPEECSRQILEVIKNYHKAAAQP